MHACMQVNNVMIFTDLHSTHMVCICTYEQRRCPQTPGVVSSPDPTPKRKKGSVHIEHFLDAQDAAAMMMIMHCLAQQCVLDPFFRLGVGSGDGTNRPLDIYFLGNHVYVVWTSLL